MRSLFPALSSCLVAALLAFAAACGRDARAAEAVEPAPGARPRATAPSTGAPPARHATRATFAAVGDVLPHKMTKATARWRAAKDPGGNDANNEGYDATFSALHGVIDRFDVATYNMETPVTREDYLPPARLRFRALLGMPRALRAAGFDVAVCANNHALDQGPNGLRESYANLHAAGLRTVGCGPTFGEASEPVIVEANGIRIGILAFARILNAYNPATRTRPDVPQVLFWYAFDDEGAEVLRAVRALRARTDVDVVVVEAHWDREYQASPLGETRSIARQLVEAGADLVIGHHPHVLQPAEWARAPDGRRAAVVYSLGNFLSDMCASLSPASTCDRRLSAVAVATFAREADGRAGLADLEILPAWTDHRSGCPGEGGEARHCVRPVVVADELARLRDELATAPAERRPRVEAEIAGFERREAMIRAFMGPHPEGQSPRSPYDSGTLARR
ncbi:MAG: CapA family protein [Polyangiales bacterium]